MPDGAPPPPAAQVPRRAGGPGRPRRVLVVEDDVLIAQDLACELEERGVEVEGPVASVAEALALLNDAEGLDLAVLDVRLADGLAYPLADALVRRGIPFAFVTGYEPWEIPSRFARVPCWQKPLERTAYSAILAAWAAGTVPART